MNGPCYCFGFQCSDGIISCQEPIPVCPPSDATHMWQSRVENVHYSASVKNELTVLINALELPLLGAQVPALFVACTSSYTHGSPLTSGRYIEYACGTVDIRWNLARFNALYLRFYNSHKHGSNTNSETDPWSKTEATLKWNRWINHTQWVQDRCNTNRL